MLIKIKLKKIIEVDSYKNLLIQMHYFLTPVTNIWILEKVRGETTNVCISYVFSMSHSTSWQENKMSTFSEELSINPQLCIEFF